MKRLVRDELRLAVAELRHKGARMGLGAGLFGRTHRAVRRVALVTAAILALVLPPWAPALVVAGVLFLLAGLAALAGRTQVEHATPPLPEETIAGIRQDVDTVRQGVHP